jgi:hypothetical protein
MFWRDWQSVDTVGQVSTPGDDRPDYGPHYEPDPAATTAQPSFGQQQPPWERAERAQPDEPEPWSRGQQGQPGSPQQQGNPEQGYAGRQDYPRQDQTGRDYPRQDYSRQDYPRQDHAGQDYPRQDYSRQDYPRRDDAGQDDTRQDYRGQRGYPDQGYPGEQGYRPQQGYDGYATSRVYGSPRGGDAGRTQAGHGSGDGPDGGAGGRRGKAGGRKPRTLLIGSVATAVVVIVAAVAFVVVRHHGNTPVTGFVPTGSTPGQDAQQLTTAFLTAWQDGDVAKAAGYTDDPAAAQASLTAYGKDLGLKGFTVTYQGDSATTVRPAASSSLSASASASASAAAAMPHESVTFLVADTVSAPYDGKVVSGTWHYHSTLVAYQQAGSPAWWVSWQPALVAPNITTATHLAATVVPPKVEQVTDGAGGVLTSYNDPGLNTISGLLSQAAPVNQGGSPGLDVEIANAKGVAVANSQAPIVNANNIPTLATTIMPQAETAAQSAVKQHAQSSMVVIQPSTGNVLAIANNAGFNDFALTAEVAPGSTMKIITSTSLFNSGTLTPDSPVECPPTFTVQGITYHNDKGESEPASEPFSDDFAQSCNNAFTSQWSHLNGAYSLAATAKTYYGLDQNWGIGIPGVTASYFNAPASASGAELAQEAFGQGELIASPLAMASVAATVDTGTFKQPILIQGTQQVTATPLPATTDADLKELMRAVVTSGTASGLNFGSTVYAKTGTADIQGQEQPNSWLVAFDPTKDVAVACLVLKSGYGASIAGPEVASFLNNYGGL